ncbi:hypothetical protein VTK56DRAFT_338 [Thermocarpiscus australiensis]
MAVRIENESRLLLVSGRAWPCHQHERNPYPIYFLESIPRSEAQVRTNTERRGLKSVGIVKMEHISRENPEETVENKTRTEIAQCEWTSSSTRIESSHESPKQKAPESRPLGARPCYIQPSPSSSPHHPWGLLSPLPFPSIMKMIRHYEPPPAPDRLERLIHPKRGGMGP